MKSLKFIVNRIRGTEIRNFPKNLDPHFFNSILKRRSENPTGRNFTNFYSREIFLKNS